MLVKMQGSPFIRYYSMRLDCASQYLGTNVVSICDIISVVKLRTFSKDMVPEVLEVRLRHK